jgi:hypothetical protein
LFSTYLKVNLNNFRGGCSEMGGYGGGGGEGPSSSAGSSYYSSRAHTATLSSSPKPEPTLTGQQQLPYPTPPGYPPQHAYSYPPQQQQYGLNPAYNAMYVQQQQYPPLPANSYPGWVMLIMID